MSALDQAGARDLLVRFVKKFYDERHSPVPGALVKASLVTEAQKEGAEFSEHHLGFRKFIEFVRTVPEVAIQGRSGSDILLAPVTASELLAAYAAPLPRLRRDFWRAFVEFPVENAVRLYEPAEDKILHEPKGTQRQGVPIDPVPRETQLQWRRTFSEEQPETIIDKEGGQRMGIRIAVGGLVVGAVSILAQTGAQRPAAINGGHEVVMVEPVFSPWTLLQMVRASDLIVDGTVSSLLPVINTSKETDRPMFETHSVVAVGEVLKGAIPNGSANILMAQIGGQVGNHSVSVDGGPLVVPGERYVLFLDADVRKELPNTSGMPRYAVVGVWSGKAKVTNGLVAFPPSASPALKAYNGQGVDAFLQTVRATITHPYTNTQLPIQFAPPQGH